MVALCLNREVPGDVFPHPQWRLQLLVPFDRNIQRHRVKPQDTEHRTPAFPRGLLSFPCLAPQVQHQSRPPRFIHVTIKQARRGSPADLLQFHFQLSRIPFHVHFSCGKKKLLLKRFWKLKNRCSWLFRKYLIMTWRARASGLLEHLPWVTADIKTVVVSLAMTSGVEKGRETGLLKCFSLDPSHMQSKHSTMRHTQPFLFYFEMGSPQVAEADLEPVILLPQPSE